MMFMKIWMCISKYGIDKSGKLNMEKVPSQSLQASGSNISRSERGPQFLQDRLSQGLAF